MKKNLKLKNIFLSVIIPAYDEEQNIERGVLEEIYSYLQKQKYSWEVIIVDDGSTDRTMTLVTTFVKKHKGFSLLRIPHSGKAGAIIAGFRKAKGEIMLFTDFDQSVPISEIRKLLPLFSIREQNFLFGRNSSRFNRDSNIRPQKNLFAHSLADSEIKGSLPVGRQGYDVVIGSRVSRRGAPLSRKLTGYGFIMLQKLLLGLPYKDTQCGFKAFTREAAVKIMKHIVIFSRDTKRKGYAPTAGFDLAILATSQKLGLKVAEVPVRWEHREKNTFNALKVSLLALKDIIFIRRIRDIRP